MVTSLLNRLLFVTVLVALSPTWLTRAAKASIEFDHAEDSTLFFKGTQQESALPLKTSLHEIEYIGTLNAEPEKKVPATFLFRAKPCTNCLQDYGIYALKYTGGPLTSFVYPGKILENKSRAVVYESRAFFGKCVLHRGDAYVVFQKEKVDKRPGMQSSVFIAEPGAEHMQEHLIESRIPRLQDTLKAVKLKLCHEIAGRSRLMLSKPLDLKSRNPVDQDKEEDDSDSEDDDLPANSSAPST